MFNNFFRKLCHLWDNVAKYIRPGRAHDNKRIRIACWVTKITDTHSECVMFASVLSYVLPTLPLLFVLCSAHKYSRLGRLPVYRFLPHFGLIKLNIFICKWNSKWEYMEGGTKGIDVEMFTWIWRCFLRTSVSLKRLKLLTKV